MAAYTEKHMAQWSNVLGLQYNPKVACLNPALTTWCCALWQISPLSTLSQSTQLKLSTSINYESIFDGLVSIQGESMTHSLSFTENTSSAGLMFLHGSEKDLTLTKLILYQFTRSCLQYISEIFKFFLKLSDQKSQVSTVFLLVNFIGHTTAQLEV